MATATIMIRIEGDETLHKRLKHLATERGVSVQRLVRELIEVGLKEVEQPASTPLVVAPVPAPAPKPVIHSRSPQFSRGGKSPFTPVRSPAAPENADEIRYEPDESS